MSAGIYQIENRVNGKKYIGQSQDLSLRKLAHFSALRRGSHHNNHLQRSFDNYGQEHFDFQVIEFVEVLSLNMRERYWISTLDTMNIDKGYNMNPGGVDSSSKEQYQSVRLYDSTTGQKVRDFDTIKNACQFMQCHTSTADSALKSQTGVIKNQFYIRRFFNRISESIDVEYLQRLRRLNKQRASRIGNHVKVLTASDWPDTLLSCEQMKDVITGPLNETNYQIHGIDLNLIKVEKIVGKAGVVSVEKKTQLCNYEAVQAVNNHWTLDPGTYNIEFKQGCNIPKHVMMLIRQRSSLLRNGSIIHSSMFDAGFKTKNIGTIMIVTHPIVIEVGARVACAYGHTCPPVKHSYSGQWQNDKQRK